MKNKILFAGLMLATCLGALVVLPTPVSAELIPIVTVQIPEPIPGKKPSFAAVIEPSSKVQNLGSNWLRCGSPSIYDCELGVMAASATFVEGEYYAYEIRLQRIEVPDYFLDTKFTINGLSPGSINVHNIAEATIRSKVYQAKHTYGYTLTPSSNYTFSAKTVGYSSLAGYNFTVQNTSTTGITIKNTISGSGASAFNITTALPYDPTSNIGLGSGGGKATFTLTPKTGLAAGTYSATVTVSGEKVASRSFNISFTVNSASATTYSITVQDDGNGIAWADKTSAAAGANVTLYTNAKPGYMFKKWDVVSGGVKMMGSEFTMPSNNVTVKALFEKIPKDGETVTSDDSDSDGDGTLGDGDEDTVKDDSEGGSIVGGVTGKNKKEFNWLWILFGAFAAIAAGGGIWFLIVKKREEDEEKKDKKKAGKKANKKSKKEQA